MSPPANIASLIVIAGFGIAAGIAVLYHYLTNSESEEPQRHHRNPSPPRRRRSRSPFPPERSPPFPTRVRAISPPRSPPRAIPTRHPGASTLNPDNGVRHRQAGEIQCCEICLILIPTNSSKPIKELDCRHVFHDECYTIWRYAVVMRNPLARLCPSCT